MKNTNKKITPFILLLLVLISCPVSAMPQKKGDIITAKVIETMNSGGYTYMLVENNEKSEWIAIPKSKIEKGSEVRFYQGTVMKNFTSKTLKRTFDTIIFSPGLEKSDATSPHSTTFHKTEDSFTNAVKAENTVSRTNRKNTSGGSLAAIVPFESLNIRKVAAENGYTVDEIFQNAEKLNGKEITVRGKVVKFSPMIMGRNWVHLQDGTGNAMKNEHDLVITTQNQAKEGEIVVVRGVIAANKDFGAGYTYEVLVEKATLEKE